MKTEPSLRLCVPTMNEDRACTQGVYRCKETAPESHRLPRSVSWPYVTIGSETCQGGVVSALNRCSTLRVKG